MREQLQEVKLTNDYILSIIKKELNGKSIFWIDVSKEVKIITALVLQESDWQIFDVSHTGALWLGQMLQPTYYNTREKKWFNPFQKDVCLKETVRHLRKKWNMIQSSDLTLIDTQTLKMLYTNDDLIEMAITAYNGGEWTVTNAVKKSNYWKNWRVYIEKNEPRDYYDRVMKREKELN